MRKALTFPASASVRKNRIEACPLSAAQKRRPSAIVLSMSRTKLATASGSAQSLSILACNTLFAVGGLARLEGQWVRCLRAHLAALRHYESGGIADNRLWWRECESDIECAR